MKMTIFLIVFLSVAVAGFTDDVANSEQQVPEIAEELRALTAYLNDQQEFERKVRAFDKLHIGIARSAYAQARELEKKGEADSARSASEKARHHLHLVKEAYELGMSRFDRSAVLHNFYGELLHDFLGKPHEATRYWRRAVQLDGQLARAHCNIGMASLHFGMYAIGMESLDTALRLEPDNPDFLFNMTQIYLVHFEQIMRMRKWDRKRVYREAMKLSEKAAKLAPTEFDIVRDHALNYFLSEDFGVKVKWRDAAKAWQQARELARTEDEVFNCWLNEARVHIRNKDSRRAQACLDQAQALFPDSPAVKKLLDDFRE